MSMMEFFPSVGAEENLSLQDMIECDIQSVPSGDHWRVQTPSLEHIMPLTVIGGYGSLEEEMNGGSDMQDMSWIQDSDGLQENNNPNLLVNPQTGLPIGQDIVPVTTTSQSQTIKIEPAEPTSVQTISLQPAVSERIVLPQSLQVNNQGQYVNVNNVMQVVATTQAQRVFLQPQNNTRQVPSSPLRHVQNISQGVAPRSPTVTYATTQQLLNAGLHSPQKITLKTVSLDNDMERSFPKPAYSYSCLIAMSLKNCDSGCLPVSEIYTFMTENFPYFKTAPDGWKNSVRHNLSLNKCFEKIENPKSNGNTKKGCLWAMNPSKIDKMDEEIGKWRKKDLLAIKRSMSKPELLEMLEKGLGKPSLRNIKNNSGNTNNNNTNKLLTTVSSNPVTAAILNGATLIKQESSSGDVLNGVKIIKQEPKSDVEPKRFTANVNVIEIKKHATTIKIEPKTEIDVKDFHNITFNSDELSALDSTLALDPELAFQVCSNGLFDDLGSDDLHLDDLPVSTSPLNFSFTSAGSISASPLTVSTAGNMLGDIGGPPPYLSSSSGYFNSSLPSPPPYSANRGHSSPAMHAVRTVSATT